MKHLLRQGALLLVFFLRFGVLASNTCVNQLTKFVPIGELEYNLGSDKYLPLSVDKKKYFCYSFTEKDASYGSRGYEVAKIIATVMSKSYLPALNSGPLDDDSDDFASCFKNGRNYCCGEGVNYYIIPKMKLCEKMVGRYDEEMGTWIANSEDLSDTSYIKVAAIVDYGCNQQARGRKVSLRFNGNMTERCKEY
eukprot:jgi/Picre1/29965/NNA_005341.t1